MVGNGEWKGKGGRGETRGEERKGEEAREFFTGWPGLGGLLLDTGMG